MVERSVKGLMSTHPVGGNQTFGRVLTKTFHISVINPFQCEDRTHNLRGERCLGFIVEGL
jgi:hypothetical protein